MKQSLSPVEQLIQRFRNNECTPEELALLQQWVHQLDLLDEADELSLVQLEAMKTRMHQQLLGAPVVAMKRRLLVRRIAIAAGWLLFITTTAFLYFYLRPTVVPVAAHQPLLTVIENDRPGIRRVTLPDGSQVWLNMYSRLSFDPQQFNSSARLVTLSGEGFFEVVPAVAAATKEKIPFIVNTGSLRTRVLGTAFNIEAYEQESEVRVSLVHGKVALDDTATNKTTLLAPNQAVRYSKQQQAWEVLPVDAASVSSWTSGHQVFSEVPLQEALERIGRRYQLTIAYDPALVRNKRITASFTNSNWQSVLSNILFVHDMKFKKVGEKVEIYR